MENNNYTLIWDPAKHGRQRFTGLFRICSIILLLGLWTTNSMGQLAMTESTFTGTYNAISLAGGATASTAAGDDGNQLSVPIGFSFNYLGTSYSVCQLSTNGWLSFSTTASGSFSNVEAYSTLGPNNSLMPYMDDFTFSVNSVLGTPPSLLYQTQGVAPNRTFTAQWTNVCAYRTAGGSALNFQVVLYETTNIVEFRYGPRTIGANLTGQSASIGLENATGGNNNYLDALTGSAKTGHYYLTEWQFPQYFFRFTPGAPTALAAGTYNVGVGQTYRNLQEAAMDVNQRGVSGAVTFNLTDAAYDTSAANGANIFPILLGPITGTSATNTVTFTKSGAPAIVRWGGSIASSTNGAMVNQASTAINGSNVEPVIGLVGADFVTINNIDVRGNVGAQNVDHAIGVYNSSATDGASNNTISNFRCQMNRGNTGTRGIIQNTITAPTSAAGTNSSNRYLDLNITSVYAGVVLTGNSGGLGLRDTLNQIGTSSCTSFNVIGDPATANDIGNSSTQTWGIRTTNQANCKVFNNSVRNVTGSAIQADGIFMEAAAGTSELYNNKVQTIRNSSTSSTTAIAGIRASHVTSAPASIRIYNNAVSEILSSYTGVASATRTIKGIFISGTGGTTAQGYAIHNNSVSIDGSASLNISSTCFEIGTTSGPVFNLANNNFANFTAAQGATAKHSCMFSTSATTFGPAGTSSNNNNFFIANDVGTSGHMGIGNTTTYNTAALWASAMTPAGMEAASVAVNPLFVSNTSDLHIGAAGLNGSGQTPPAYVSVDLDCAPRTPDNDIGAYKIDGCTAAVGGTASFTGGSSSCVGLTKSMSSVGATAPGAGLTYQWEVSLIGGGAGFANVTGGTGANSANYTTGILTAGTYFYRLNVTCSSGPVTGYSNEIILTVNALPTVTVSPNSATICQPGGSAINLTAGGAVNYAWNPTSGLSPTSGSPVAANPSATTTYTVTGTDANGCTNTATAVITVNPSPQNVTATATPPTVCAGGTSNLSASASLPSNYNVGTASGILSTTGSPYRAGSGSPVKTQLLYTAAELTASGMVAGPISALGFTASNPTGTVSNFEIRIGHTALSALTTTFETAPAATVFTQASFTPVNGINMHTFNAGTFSWDGVSNILIQTCLVNNISGTAACSTYTAASQNVQATATNACSASLTGSISASKPIIRFVQSLPVSFSWSPAGSVISPLSQNTATVALNSTTPYTVTASFNGCSATANVSVVIDPLNCSAATTSTSTCENTNFTVTANHTGGGAPFSYVWSDGIGGSYPNAQTITANLPAGSYTFTCTVSDNCGASCTSTVTVNVNPAPGGTATGPATGVTYQNLQYQVTGFAVGSTFQWQSATALAGPYTNITGVTTATANLNASSAGTFYVQCVVTSTAGCTSVAGPVTTVISVAGDNVCDAITLPLGASGPYTNVGATTQPGEALPTQGACTGQTSWCSAGGGISNTVWFKFVAPASGKVSIHFLPGNWDSQIALYSAGGGCNDLLTGAGVVIAANDDSSGSSPFNAFIAPVCLTPGTTYFVQVDGYANTTNPAFGLLLIDEGNVAPVISNCPASVNVTAPLNGCTATATWTAPTAADPDNCIAPLTFTSNYNPGDAFPIGATTVTYTANDGFNTVTCSFTVNVAVNPANLWYADGDGDGYGAGAATLSCTQPSGFVSNNTDCNDGSAAVNPAATEICNTIDDDCDGLTDNADPSVIGQTSWYVDGDVDGYGAGSATLSCTAISGSVTNNVDCNDADAAINPGATEICNTIDDDCDGLTDNADPSITGQPSWYADGDGDGYGAGAATLSCTQPSGFVSNNADCNDGSAAVNPAATEICNGIDDNCNGLTDDNVPALPSLGTISGTAASCRAGVAGTAAFSIAPVAGATTYAWTVPAGFTITTGQGTTSITVSYTAIAIQTGISGPLCVTASDACVSTAPSCISIDYQIAAPVTPPSISGPGKVCPGDVVVYSISTVARATSYTWTVPGTMTIQGGQGTNVITVQVNPGYTGGTLSVIASNVCGSSAARTKALTVNLPGTPTAIQGQKEGLCNTTGNIFSIPAVVNATSYIWNVTGGTITGGQGTTSITVDVATLIGGGSITVQAVNGCGASLIRTLTISGAPARAGLIAGATSVCDNTNEAYSVATVPGAGVYTWSVTVNGSVSTGQGTKNITIDWLAPAAAQSISVVTSNACGTSLTRTLSGITINNCPRIGSAESNVFNMSAYPNPATDRVTVEFTAATDNSDYRMRIADMTGRTFLMETGTAASGLNTKVLPLNGLASGVYMISIEMLNAQQQIKLIVE